jgi:hypothetical protein
MTSTRIIARAEVRGRLVELAYSDMIMFENNGTDPSTETPAPPPRRVPARTSPKLTMAAKLVLTSSPVRLIGRMTRRKACQRVAPRSRAAWIRSRSMLATVTKSTTIRIGAR